MYSYLLWLSSLFLIARFTNAYDPLPRWGQAAALINDALLIYGGKVDEFNSYSYTAAPNQNDILYLPLSVAFDVASPPWELVDNATISQGPKLAWHTLTPFNSSQSLLFGGEPGPGSLVPPTHAALLDTSNALLPIWNTGSTASINLAPNRIRHTSTTTPSGRIFLIGGERPDGSRIGFSDHSVFNVDDMSFTQLPTDNGPPDIYGHAAVLLSNGHLLVFGGYSQSLGTLLSFEQIWILDTTGASASWSLLTLQKDVSSPAPRRAFAAVALNDHLVLIQGGSDADLQRNFDDGWVLDLSQEPPLWSLVSQLSQIGPRRDHFAVVLGDHVLFGFGHENDAAAPAALILYDWVQNSFASAYTPTLPPTLSHTIPIPTQMGTGIPPGPGASHPNQPSGLYPTSTEPSSPNQPQPTEPTERPDSSRSTIALGTVFGLLALVVGGATAIYYVRRRRSLSHRPFTPLYGQHNAGDGDESLHLGGEIPTAGQYQDVSRQSAFLQSLGFSTVLGATFGRIRSEQRRRDMLADEDTRQFGEWYPHRRGGTDTSWSWRSVILGQRSSRAPSTSTSATTRSTEKVNPFADTDDALTEEDITQALEFKNFSANHHDYSSYASRGSRHSYTDPFADPLLSSGSETLTATVEKFPDLSAPPPPRIYASIPTTDSPYATEVPLNQTPSQNDDPSSQSSHENLSPFGSASALSSTTSQEQMPLVLPPSSLINSSLPGSQFIRRSDTWWSRLTKSNFLDRRSSDASRRYPKLLDIRDPNPPPPLLGTIEESEMSTEPFEGDTAPGADGLPYGPHGVSRTSLKTTGTTDTLVIERIAGTMVVVQRAIPRDGRRTDSTNSTISVDDSPPQSRFLGEASTRANTLQSESPTEERSEAPRPPPSAFVYPKRGLPRAGAVVARIQAYERRLTQEQEQAAHPTSLTHRPYPRRHTKGYDMNYGLIPKPNLFIANPDRRSTSS